MAEGAPGLGLWGNLRGGGSVRLTSGHGVPVLISVIVPVLVPMRVLVPVLVSVPLRALPGARSLYTRPPRTPPRPGTAEGRKGKQSFQETPCLGPTYSNRPAPGSWGPPGAQPLAAGPRSRPRAGLDPLPVERKGK